MTMVGGLYYFTKVQTDHFVYYEEAICDETGLMKYIVPGAVQTFDSLTNELKFFYFPSSLKANSVMPVVDSTGDEIGTLSAEELCAGGYGDFRESFNKPVKIRANAYKQIVEWGL